MIISFRKRKKITPRELRRKHGKLTETNVTAKELKDGALRQWQRYNDSHFQEKELDEKLNKMFGQRT